MFADSFKTNLGCGRTIVVNDGGVTLYAGRFNRFKSLVKR